MDGRAAAQKVQASLRLYYRDGRANTVPKSRVSSITCAAYRAVMPNSPRSYALLVELVGDEELETGFTF